MSQPPLPVKYNDYKAKNGYPPVPRFYQHNGRLIITQANPNVQGAYKCSVHVRAGLYTCTDDTGTADRPRGDAALGVVYVVQAHMPWLYARAHCDTVIVLSVYNPRPTCVHVDTVPIR